MINISNVYKIDKELFKLSNNSVTFIIKAHANAKKEHIGDITTDPQGKKFLNIYVFAPAIDNKANKAIIKLLASSWKLKKTQIKIIRGNNQPYKVIKLYP